MLIEVFSDIVCPWCYIGKRSLDAALETPAGEGVELIWRPYQLYPKLPVEGIDRLDFLRARYGERADASRVPERIVSEAREVGLELDFAAIETMPNTFLAHRLMDLAFASGCQHTLGETLFRYYFCEGKNVGAVEILLDAAEEVGLERRAVREYLDSDGGVEDVRRQLVRGVEVGVSGVPSYLLGGAFAIPGAQTAEVIAQVISRAKDRLATA